ncbi:MAG: NAD(P)/FAD-dependent oxidoreductase [Aestuariivirga sp.]|nr:NAD(P)/FAD-dependent oxidoreductase [Aestuariivirga sp.]
MHDVIIVGARCAGSALGLMLARSGKKVLMLERATFPSDTMSGHYVHPAGISCLKRWGVFGQLAATDTPEQKKLTLDFGPFALSATPTAAPDGTSSGYGPRRRTFDTLLAEAAVAAGVEFIDGVTVSRPLWSQGRVAGVEGHTASGTPFGFRARLVIGADGRNSTIAEAVGAKKYNETPSATCAYYSYWSGFDTPHIHLFSRVGRFFVVQPTNEGLTMVAVSWPVAEFRKVRSNIEESFNSAVAGVPWIEERFRAAKRQERFAGTADQAGFFRTSHGPGWALVGDAGYHRDAITAQGMTDAFLHAELLAQAINAGFDGNTPMDQALGEYQNKRDASVMPMYGLTNDLARLAPPPPDMTQLMGAIHGNPRATSDFLGIMSGTVGIPEFFAPANIEAIMGARLAA